MLAAINQSTPVIEYNLLTDCVAPFSILLASSMKLPLCRSSFISSSLYICQGDGMDRDHINEPLLGLSSRLVLVVSDLVSDLDVAATSSIGWLTGPILFSQPILYVCSSTWFTGALLPVICDGWDRTQARFQVRRYKGGDHRITHRSLFLQYSCVKEFCFQLIQPFLEDSIQPSLSFDTVEVDAICGQSGLIHGSQFMFNVHEDHSSGILIC